MREVLREKLGIDMLSLILLDKKIGREDVGRDDEFN